MGFKFPNLKSRRGKIIVFVALLGVASIGFIPLPIAVTPRDKELVVIHAMTTLFQNRRVLTKEGYSHLFDTAFVKDKSRVYFHNELGVPDTVFSKLGLKAVPKDRKLNVDDGDVIVSFSIRDMSRNPTTNVQFSYVFGSLGAQGYEIRIHKSIFLRYFVYIHEWVS